MGLMEKIFGDINEKEVKKIEKIADVIETFDLEMQALSDNDLRGKTQEFKKRVEAGETLDDILPEAFAVCREGAVRSLGMKHFRVQLIGGIVLHQGRISEMKTGEGKTLVATLAIYLNALEGKGAHVITVNDIWPNVIWSGWVSFIHSWGFLLAVLFMGFQTSKEKPPIRRILHTEQIMNSGLIIFVIIWSITKKK